MSRDRAFAPHCDQRVLHAPGVCEFCDEYPDWQKLRVAQGINFTGEYDPERSPDPATWARPQSQLERWHGNVPETPARKAERATLHERFLAELAKLGLPGRMS